MSISWEAALASLPHRPPFRFVDEVTSLSVDGGAGVWRVTGEEAFFGGHFPENPIVPGVLIAEAAAQLAGVVGSVRSNARGTGKLVFSDAKFKRTVEPPAQIILEVTGSRIIGSIHVFAFTATVEGECCAEGNVGLSLDGSE